VYNIEWDRETGCYILVPNIKGVTKEIRPVFFEELDLLGFKSIGNWEYPKCEEPLLWAETRRYYYKGEFVAETVGGGLYSFPEIKIYQNGLKLEPVDLSTMIEKNKALMEGLVSRTLISTYDIYKRYKRRKYDIFYVAFSGGKDSVVLLDIVSRALPHDEFVVIFGDTTMEVDDTYKAVDLAQKHWSDLQFYTAKAEYDARESWKLFGPPSRTQRWCCGVHKSAPSLLLLRQLLGKDNMKALVYDGVRAEESNVRATYDMVSDGNKHLTQSNCRPLLEWNTAELYLYIFQHNLLFNKAYRYGAIRVGCSICPLASSWWEVIANAVYPRNIKPFVDIIEEYSGSKSFSTSERQKYINSGGWKGRVGGRYLEISGCRIIEQFNGQTLCFHVREVHYDWKEWVKAIGDLVDNGEGKYLLVYKERNYPIISEKTGEGLIVTIEKLDNSREDIRLAYLIRNIFNKVAYCVGCKTCMVECPVGALFVDKNRIMINDQKCVRCQSCIDMPKGCLLAKSLNNSVGGIGMTLKGMDRYHHFGFRKEWLSYFFEMLDNFWHSDKLGSLQFGGFRVWLKESEIILNNSLSELGSILVKLGSDDIRTWAIIWTNLAYRSTIIKWFVLNTDYNTRYEPSELMSMLGDDYSQSTRKNAITSLFETLKSSPIGRELGNGICDFKGKAVIGVTRTGWQTPDDITLLYSLYKFAEKMNGHYSFTISELVSDNPDRMGVSPTKLFGISPDDLKRILQGLAFIYSDYIKVAFNKDLDNVFLESGHSSLGILNLLK
jgi:phosphoadenosine phosphosulfate reductase